MTIAEAAATKSATDCCARLAEADSATGPAETWATALMARLMTWWPVLKAWRALTQRAGFQASAKSAAANA